MTNKAFSIHEDAAAAQDIANVHRKAPTPLEHANIGGPFICAGTVTNIPTAKYLAAISNPYLREHGIIQYLLHPSQHKKTNAWRYYLCAALARQYSLRRGGARWSQGYVYLNTYVYFEAKFVHALRDAIEVHPMRVEEQNALITLERGITRETFKGSRKLLNMSFAMNRTLLEELIKISKSGILNGIYGLRETFENVQDRLDGKWVDLTDAMTILDNDDVYQSVWAVLVSQKGLLMKRLQKVKESSSGTHI